MEDQNDIKGMYKTTRNQLEYQVIGPPQQLVLQGNNITAPREIAQTQMEFFNRKIEKLMGELPRPTDDPLKVLNDAMEKWDSSEDR